MINKLSVAAHRDGFHTHPSPEEGGSRPTKLIPCPTLCRDTDSIITEADAVEQSVAFSLGFPFHWNVLSCARGGGGSTCRPPHCITYDADDEQR